MLSKLAARVRGLLSMPKKHKPTPTPAKRSTLKPSPKRASSPKKKPAAPALAEAPPPKPPPPTVELLDADRNPVGEITVAARTRLIEVSRKGGPPQLYDHVATRADGVWQYAPCDRLTG